VRVLLHACCGPCLIEPLDALVAEHEIVVFYANPNIHPLGEYERRRDTLLEYAHSQAVDVIEATYDPQEWSRATQGLEGDPRRRCQACWKLRMEMTARYAAEHGFEAIATSLTVSPYQDAEGVALAGAQAAQAVSLRYLDRDFRDRYSRATERSREAGMYRQNYCGCSYSQSEADAQRAARRAERNTVRRRDQGQ